MSIGDKVVHKLTKEKFLLVGFIIHGSIYSPDWYICKSCTYEKFEFREDEIELYKEPKADSKDEN